jgi:hypothetical protein
MTFVVGHKYCLVGGESGSSAAADGIRPLSISTRAAAIVIDVASLTSCGHGSLYLIIISQSFNMPNAFNVSTASGKSEKIDPLPESPRWDLLVETPARDCAHVSELNEIKNFVVFFFSDGRCPMTTDCR